MLRRTAALFATLLLLWAVVSEVNHLLAPAHLYFWIGGLFIAFNALTLSLRPGLVGSLLAGLLCDANSGAAFGTHTLLFAAAHAALFHLRDRLPREETAGRVVIALIANLALFLVFSFLQLSRLPEPAEVWPRLICDLLCSQVFLALIAPWYFALQTRALELADPVAATYDRRLN